MKLSLFNYPAANDKSPLIDRKEAAAYLGIKPQTLAVWASTKRYALDVIKIGRRAMYRVADLDAFIEKNAMDMGGAQ